MPMIVVRDTKLYYEKSGDGKPALLFIHGACGSARSWTDQMERLSPEFTCVAYDRRGHTRSELGVEDQSNRTHVEDARALVEALELDRPILVGSSAGGAVAAELMYLYPDLVRGAVLSEPAIMSLTPEETQAFFDDVAQAIQPAIERGDQRSAVDAFLQVVAPEFWAMTTDEEKRDRFRDNAPMFFALLETEPTMVGAAELAEIEHPVLVISGSISKPVERKTAQLTAQYLPNARFVEIEGSGHITYGEKPVEFAQAVRAFVHEVAGAAVTA